jgi:putative transposase
MKAVEELAPTLSTAEACRCLGVPRATLYRHRSPKAALPEAKPRPTPPRALSEPERARVLDVLHSPPFLDKAPAEVYAALLDQGQYLCSIRTMYRILEDHQEVRERRDQLRHPAYVKPQLVATAPRQVWTWDITKLLGPAKWTYYHLYVILDIYSDRGPSMRSQTVAQLLATLGITKSHSRPHVSDDNPFSESQFKTLKYQPDFPERFAGYDPAMDFCGKFMHWQNHEHHHWGLGLLTPAMVHFGQAEKVLAARQAVLTEAHGAHPERFVHGIPQPLQLPGEVWINPPADGPEPRMLQLPRDTNSEKHLSQTG